MGLTTVLVLAKARPTRMSRLYRNIREFFCPNLSAGLFGMDQCSKKKRKKEKETKPLVMFIRAKTGIFYVKRTNIMIAVNVKVETFVLLFVSHVKGYVFQSNIVS